VELFWTFSNVAFGIRTASKTYGLYCAAGSIGAIIGSLAMKPLVDAMGTFHTLWLVVPTLWTAAYGCKRLGKGLTLPEPAAKLGKKHDSWREGLTVIHNSHYLALLLAVVAVVQVVITVTDFQFNEVVQQQYLDPDARTTVFGYVNAVISGASFVLQIGTGLILERMGVRGVLLMIPGLIGLSLAAFVAAPTFASMAVAKILGKTMDYSLFRAAKEILYIPLSYAEKTQGKALIDMLTYRVAKGAVSLMLMGVAHFALQRYVGGFNAALCFVWLGLSWVILKRYRTLKTG
jgi:AAA family ATP:ADP antiporter